jgi:hypothetical protein
VTEVGFQPRLPEFGLVVGIGFEYLQDPRAVLLLRVSPFLTPMRAFVGCLLHQQ